MPNDACMRQEPRPFCLGLNVFDGMTRELCLFYGDIWNSTSLKMCIRFWIDILERGIHFMFALFKHAKMKYVFHKIHECVHFHIS